MIIDGSMMTVKSLLKPLQPFRLLSLIATYALGAGLVQYVESFRSVSLMVQGGVVLVLLLLTLDYLSELQRLNTGGFSEEKQSPEAVRRMRLVYGLMAATFLTIATILVIGWLQAGVLWLGLVFLLLAAVGVGALSYLAAVWEALRPYQMLLDTALVMAIPPALAFFLHTDRFHPLLTMVVICLVPIYPAYQLLTQLSHFDRHPWLAPPTGAMQMGWERAMVLHNVLILLGYVLWALMALLGFPWFLLWPVFLTLPIGLLEIWLMERVRRGGKPLWRIMKIATASIFLISVYLLGFAFWTR